MDPRQRISYTRAILGARQLLCDTEKRQEITATSPAYPDRGPALWRLNSIGSRPQTSEICEKYLRLSIDAIEIGNGAQSRFLAGLDWINARCHSEFGQAFMRCSSEQQNNLIEELAYNAKFKPTTESGRAFFR